MADFLRSFSRTTAGDALGAWTSPHGVREHLEAAVDWLERAHDASGDGGVSYGWSLRRRGWGPSYRETSGYIAPTFYELAAPLGRPRLRERAERIVRWLASVQNADGSFSNPRYGQSGIVFDTGQALFGLVRGFQETEDERLLDAAVRAGRWLTQVADAEGRWTRHTFRGVPHVYNARTAWALLELEAADPVKDAGRVRVARANLDWAVAQQRGGLFDHNAFGPGEVPFTHTIAYALRGLLEAGWLLGDSRYVESGTLGARTMLSQVGPDGFIPGQVDVDGNAADGYCCLTGNCQLAIVWLKLFERTGDDAFRDAAVRALDYVARTQELSDADPDVRGGIKGSQPVWGRYAPFSYPNWATKFFADATALRERLCPVEAAAPVRAAVLNATFDPVTQAQLVDEVSALIREGKRGIICTVNVAIAMMMRDDERLQRFVDRAWRVVVDGQPLKWVAPLFGGRIPERVTGCDLVDALCARAVTDGFKVFFLGDTDEVLAEVVRRLKERHPGLACETANGFFPQEAGAARARAVADSGAKLLFVGMGVPRQEHFLEDHWDALGVNVAIGVGGSFEVLAGVKQRAPEVLQRLGLEWAFRLAQEPRRLFKRYLVTNSRFLALVGRHAARR